jgi:hypothetical protein
MEPQAGDIVAYWPTDEHQEIGLKASDDNGYIAAMIVGVPRNEAGVGLTANLQLFPDKSVVTVTQIAETVGIDCALATVPYSEVPAPGCWSWLPRV